MLSTSWTEKRSDTIIGHNGVGWFVKDENGTQWFDDTDKGWDELQNAIFGQTNKERG